MGDEDNEVNAPPTWPGSFGHHLAGPNGIGIAPNFMNPQLMHQMGQMMNANNLMLDNDALNNIQAQLQQHAAAALAQAQNVAQNGEGGGGAAPNGQNQQMDQQQNG